MAERKRHVIILTVEEDPEHDNPVVADVDSNDEIVEDIINSMIRINRRHSLNYCITHNGHMQYNNSIR